ncbi:hypothetical protein ABG768_018833 [Culter alburnus]|uniref:Lipoxygenase domain-containing protein n=1 Tax=Culter alburnus TaxID=194366 RepID=A0AAW2AUG5_CULAL
MCASLCDAAWRRHVDQHSSRLRDGLAEGCPQSLRKVEQVDEHSSRLRDGLPERCPQSLRKLELAALKLTGLADSRRSWESMSQLEVILCENRGKTIEYIQEHWDEDEFFGYQFLNGLNPMMIQRCSKLPENFPVTDDMVKDSLRGSSLKQEMKKGNIFLSDYKMLDGLVGNVVNDRQQYLTAPLVLLYNNPHGMMLPIAIQLRQKPSKENPIFLPTDSKADWKLAKIFVRNAEFAVHEVDFHLLRTHLLAEVFTVATLRNLPPPHPLYKYAGVGGESLATLLKRATASLTYSALCLPDNISERALENVPHYYYRDDGMKLWNIINKFVAAFLSHYYQCDAHMQKDTELQQWISEIFTNGFLGRDGSGIPSSLQTVTELVKFVTMVIFTASDLNNGQFDFGGWMPNYPSALRKPPPKEKGQTTEDTILETLPDVSTTVNIMAVLRLLTQDSADQYPLGHFPENLHDEEVPCKLIEEFQKDLRKLSDLIEERNKNLELPYTYLNPKNVDNSVAI